MLITVSSFLWLVSHRGKHIVNYFSLQGNIFYHCLFLFCFHFVLYNRPLLKCVSRDLDSCWPYLSTLGHIEPACCWLTLVIWLWLPGNHSRFRYLSGFSELGTCRIIWLLLWRINGRWWARTVAFWTVLPRELVLCRVSVAFLVISSHDDTRDFSGFWWPYGLEVVLINISNLFWRITATGGWRLAPTVAIVWMLIHHALLITPHKYVLMLYFQLTLRIQCPQFSYTNR